jgi:hypothetical protein
VARELLALKLLVEDLKAETLHLLVVALVQLLLVVEVVRLTTTAVLTLLVV